MLRIASCKPQRCILNKHARLYSVILNDAGQDLWTKKIPLDRSPTAAILEIYHTGRLFFKG
jgi:hypothetical protein